MSTEATTPNVAITYCRLCGWLLRASWMAQELLTTFAEELGSVTLIPDDTGGVFEVRLDGKLLWSRKEHGRFPDIKELKQLVRDATDLTAAVAPWLQADHDGLTGTVLKWPERDEIDAPVQEQLIVELYSK